MILQIHELKPKWGIAPNFSPINEMTNVGGAVSLFHSILDSMYICTYHIKVEFEWDCEKAILNLKKHGVDFADAVSVLEDERAITVPDDYPDEERFITIGMDSFGRILVVVYTWRKTRIRLISARKATAKEISQYKG